jgi:Uma2 family endonuclease
MAVDPGKLLTYEDYLAFPDDGIRREIVEGKVYELSAPTVRHQALIGHLYLEIALHIRSHGGGRVYVAALDVRLAEHDIVQPDVIFVADDRLGVIDEKYMMGAPSLLVEVLSDPRHDRVRKRRIYARDGVPEYWIVDPKADHVEIYTLAGDEYAEPRIVAPGERLTIAALPGLAIDVAALFEAR